MGPVVTWVELQNKKIVYPALAGKSVLTLIRFLIKIERRLDVQTSVLTYRNRL